MKEPFAAGGDVAAVTWSNLMERLKGLAALHSFYVFPKLWNRNLSHISARREYVLK